MAKRFTDTEKWKKPFIRGLQGAYKLLWLYIIDECDHAGIWQVDIEVAALRLGEPSLSVETALKEFGGKVKPFDNGEKWFIPDFIEFQYNGDLNPANKTHKSVLKILNKYHLLEKEEITTTTKPLPSPLQGVKDKDKDKELDKDKDLDMGGAGGKAEEIETAIEEYFTDEPVREEKTTYHDPEGFNEEEYAEAVKFLMKSNVYPLVQQHYRKRPDEALLLFKTFYEQKFGFGELRNKTPNEVMKWFYQWVPKYLASNQNPKATGSVLQNQLEKAKIRQQKYN